jgi:hypothetical protein
LYESRRRWKETALRLRQKSGRAAKEIIALKLRVEFLEALLQGDSLPQLGDTPQLVDTHQGAGPQVPGGPEESPLPFHSFSASMISLCVNVAKRVGLRASEDVLHIVFEWLGQSRMIPDWTTIRGWCQRIGLAQLSAHGQHGDWIWIVDHSNQIGQEKVLVILGIRASELPEKGSTLALRCVKPLMLRVGKSWSQVEMRQAYQDLEKQVGTPRAILADGAVELRESVDGLKNRGKGVLVLSDYKHYLANRLESIVGNTAEFAEFLKQVTSTRSAIQQTELAAFTPPSLKSKSRFMNLDTLYEWSQMVLWQLENRDSDLWKLGTAERIESKLGWLRQMKGKLKAWFECQEFIRQSCHLVNTEGIYRGLHKKLRMLGAHVSREQSQRLVEAAVTFVRNQESNLRRGERLWLSTEILESLFGHYKQLEGQHSKSGFTSLILAIGIYATKITPEVVEQSMKQVKVKDVKAWTKKHLPKTLASSKASAYRQYRKATQNRATLSSNAA